METSSLSILNQGKSNRNSLVFAFQQMKNKDLFADPLGLQLNSYPHDRDRESFAALGVSKMIQAPLQKLYSNLYGIHCIFIAHFVFGADFRLIHFVGDQKTLRFVNHFIFCCLPL